MVEKQEKQAVKMWIDEVRGRPEYRKRRKWTQTREQLGCLNRINYNFSNFMSSNKKNELTDESIISAAPAGTLPSTKLFMNC